jgi:hypothetical protein
MLIVIAFQTCNIGPARGQYLCSEMNEKREMVMQ